MGSVSSSAACTRFSNYSNMVDWLYDVYSGLQIEQFCLCLITVWMIWYVHNTVRQGTDLWVPNILAQQVTKLFKEFMDAKNFSEVLRSAVTRQFPALVIKWVLLQWECIHIFLVLLILYVFSRYQKNKTKSKRMRGRPVRTVALNPRSRAQTPPLSLKDLNYIRG